MKPKIIFTIYAALLGIFGLGSLIAPQMFLQALQMPADTTLLLLGNLGAVQIGLAAIYGLARNSGPSQARDALLLGGASLHAVLIAGILISMSAGPLSLLIGNLVLPVLFLVGFSTSWWKYRTSAQGAEERLAGSVQGSGG